jgi:hypothetical protein
MRCLRCAYTTLLSLVAIQSHGFNSSFDADFHIAIIATSHTVFRSKSGGFDASGYAA